MQYQDSKGARKLVTPLYRAYNQKSGTSHDPVGILRQILTALIVWGLLVIANQDAGQLSPKQLWRQLQADIHQAILEYGYCLSFQGVVDLLV
jgi:hypothetical protein